MRGTTAEADEYEMTGEGTGTEPNTSTITEYAGSSGWKNMEKGLSLSDPCARNACDGTYARRRTNRRADLHKLSKRRICSAVAPQD